MRNHTSLQYASVEALSTDYASNAGRVPGVWRSHIVVTPVLPLLIILPNGCAEGSPNLQESVGVVSGAIERDVGARMEVFVETADPVSVVGVSSSRVRVEG